MFNILKVLNVLNGKIKVEGLNNVAEDAEDRQKEWEKKLEITRQEVENIIKCPEQIVPGDQHTLVA
jgi:hypothetical protein